MPGTLRSGQRLLIDLALKRHEGVQERFRARRAAGYVHVHRNVTVDAFKHIVSLLEWAAGDRASAHRNDVFRLRHLVVESDDLRGHLLRHRAGDNHQVSLAWRGPEDLSAKPGEVPAGHGRGDHLDGAARQAKADRKSTRLNSSHLGISY